MSGSGIQFIRSNPFLEGWNAAEDRAEQRRKRDEEQAVDLAIRKGVRRSMEGADTSMPDSPPPLQAPRPGPAGAGTPSSGVAVAADFTATPTVNRAASRPDSELYGRNAPLAASRDRYASVAGRPAEGSRFPRQPENDGPHVLGPDGRPELDENGQPRENPWHALRGQLPAPNGRMADTDAAPPPPAGVTREDLPAPRPTPASAPGGGRRNMDPVLDQLTMTPGGGRAALGIIREERADRRAEAREGRMSRQQDERMALQALGRGDIDTYRFFARRSGGEMLPDEVLQNAATRARIATGGLLAQRIYGDDEEGQHRFLNTYLRTGDAAQSLEAGGQPRSGGRWSVQRVQRGEWEYLEMFDPRNPAQAGRPVMDSQGQPARRHVGTRTGTFAGDDGQPVIGSTVPRDPSQPMRPVTGQDGEPVRPAPPAAQRGRQLDREARRDMLVRAGVPPEEAARIAAGGAPTPNAILQTLRGVQRSVSENPRMARATPQEREAAVQREMDTMFGPGWRDSVRAPGSGRPGGGAPSAANPNYRPSPERPAPTDAERAADLPAPPDAPGGGAGGGGIPPRPPSVPPGSAWSPSRRQWRAPDGTLFSEDGRPPA
ncbi:MAG: hypothetical protein K2X74_20150 [Acetobacteraceae bacterium]|nr:hypothetical protein [Acetobacteraceae bacterium]